VLLHDAHDDAARAAGVLLEVQTGVWKLGNPLVFVRLSTIRVSRRARIATAILDAPY
jgi:hypothetical protein